MFPLNSIAILCISIAVLAAPWPIGGNWPFARMAFLLFAIVVLGLATLRQFQVRTLRFPWVWTLLLLGIGFSILQIVWLDSVYPAASREKLVDLILGVGVFFACSALLSQRQNLTPVLLAMTVCGVLVSGFGVFQRLSWNGKIFWEYELLNGGFPFASFVNSNNAAGFLLVTFAASLYFVANQVFQWSFANEPQGLVLASTRWETDESDTPDSIIGQLLKIVAGIQPKHLYCAAAVAIIFAGTVSTLSRGGMLGLAFASLVAALLIARSNRWLAVLFVIALVGAGVGLAVYSEQSVAIFEEIQSLGDIESAAAPRLDHWKEAWPFALKNLPSGVGNGTYRFVSPTFQIETRNSTFAHAENIYLQTLVEMGVVGLSILILVLASCGWACRTLLYRVDVLDRALGVAGLSCLAGQAVASFLDFGLYQPANQLLMAVMMGAVVGRVASQEHRGAKSSSRDDATNHSGSSKSATSLVLLIALVGTGWAIYESVGIESRKRAERDLALIADQADPQSTRTSDYSFEKTQRQIQRAVSIRPDDAEAHFIFGEYYVMRFRNEFSRNLADEIRESFSTLPPNEPMALSDEFDSPEELSPASVWPSTSLSMLHRELMFAARRPIPVPAELASNAVVKKYLPDAWREFQTADSKYSLLRTSGIRLAQLGPLFAPGTESELLQGLLDRSPPSSQLYFDAGLLALNSGNQKLCVELWSKCLNSNRSRAYESNIIHFSQLELPMKDLFERVLPQNPDDLLRIVSRYFASPDLILPKKLLLVHTRRVIESADLTDAQREFALAEAARMGQDFETAVVHYQQALEHDPSQIGWRFEYAKCLHETKNFAEAIRQLKICELEPSRFHSRIKPMLDRIRRDRSSSHSRN